MATKAGVWIDHKHAIVVLITDKGKQTKKISLDIGQPVGTAGKSTAKKKYAPNDFVPEDRLERKSESARKDSYDDIIECIKGADALLILGPGEAKGEFGKRLKAKMARGVVAELKTADKMTERQFAAKVQQHFAPSSAKKHVVSKKTMKMEVKAPARKSTQKSGN